MMQDIKRLKNLKNGPQLRIFKVNYIGYIEKTGKRKPTFEVMVKFLDDVRKYREVTIVETGCCRQEDNFEGDGMSTMIFDSYVNEHGGHFYSVDISQENIDFAKSKCISSNTQNICSDSIPFLFGFNNKNTVIDLLYLDSYDFDMANPHPSSLHHIFELTAIMPSLRIGSLIVVDDNFNPGNPGETGVGKGGYIKQFMEHLGKPIAVAGYQWIWQL